MNVDETYIYIYMYIIYTGNSEFDVLLKFRDFQKKNLDFTSPMWREPMNLAV